MRIPGQWLEKFMDALKNFSEKDTHIESVIVVGSYARGTNRADSDLDLCMITANKRDMIQDPDFVRKFGTVEKMRIEDYGACTSIRVWYEHGLEVEFGIVEPSWISRPLDEGTRRVLSGGYRVIVDKKHYFKNVELP